MTDIQSAAQQVLAAAAGRLLGEPVGEFAERELFAPLGIRDAEWPADPDRVSCGYAHLRMSAARPGPALRPAEFRGFAELVKL